MDPDGAALPIGAYGVLALILFGYFILGAIMDELAMILLTVPIVFPVIVQLGFDPIWFGVIIVMAVTLGMILPPVGINVFVINSIARDISLPRIYKGVAPFVVSDLIRLVILVRWTNHWCRGCASCWVFRQARYSAGLGRSIGRLKSGVPPMKLNHPWLPPARDPKRRGWSA